MPKFLQFSLFTRLFGMPPRAKVRPRLSPARSRSPNLTSDQELKLRFDNLIEQYFPERQDLKSYVVRWSARRQKRTLGSCSVSKHRINIARELSHADSKRWVEAVLYHELCHAVLGKDVGKLNGKRAWHGIEFRALERRHPQIEDLNRWIRSGGWGRAVRVDRASRRK